MLRPPDWWRSLTPSNLQRVALQVLRTACDRTCGLFWMGTGDVVDVVDEPAVVVVVVVVDDDEFELEHPPTARAVTRMTADTGTNDRLIR